MCPTTKDSLIYPLPPSKIVENRAKIVQTVALWMFIWTWEWFFIR